MKKGQTTTPWRVSLGPRRPRERYLSLRATRTVNGVREEFRESTGTNDANEAERLRVILETDLNTRADASSGDPTFLGLWRAKIDDLERDPDASINTLRNYQAGLLSIRQTPLGSVRSSQVCKGLLIRTQDALVKLVAKKSTAAHYMALAAAVWRWAVEREVIHGAWPEVGRRNRIKADETAKRPYTDSEVGRILDWIDEAAPDWSAVFHLLADTGQRVGAILGLQGKDVIEDGDLTRVHFQRQWVGSQTGSWRKLKTKKSVVTPLPPDTARRLPRVGPNDLLFPNAKDRTRPARIETIRDNLHRAAAAIGIGDAENLDVHSFRRAWVATAKRNGVADAVGMKITGHSQESIYDGYGRNVVGDDLVQAVEAVHAARKRARETPANRDLPRLSHGPVAEPLDPKDLAERYDLTS